jgi:hypothetical protein
MVDGMVDGGKSLYEDFALLVKCLLCANAPGALFD